MSFASAFRVLANAGSNRAYRLLVRPDLAGGGESKLQLDRGAAPRAARQLAMKTPASLLPAGTATTAAAVEVREAMPGPPWMLFDRRLTVHRDAGKHHPGTPGPAAKPGGASGGARRSTQLARGIVGADPAAMGGDRQGCRPAGDGRFHAGHHRLCRALVIDCALWLVRRLAPGSPAAADAADGDQRRGPAAYRVDGMEVVASPQNLSVGTVVTPELLNAGWVKLALPEPTTATKIVNFRRVAPAAALLACSYSRFGRPHDSSLRGTPRRPGRPRGKD